MEKVINEEVVTQQITHEFYCDKCGKLIGSSKEWDDGYYEELGLYNQSINVTNDGWYKFSGHYCIDCKTAKKVEFMKLLFDFGFEKE